MRAHRALPLVQKPPAWGRVPSCDTRRPAPNERDLLRRALGGADRSRRGAWLRLQAGWLAGPEANARYSKSKGWRRGKAAAAGVRGAASAARPSRPRPCPPAPFPLGPRPPWAEPRAPRQLAPALFPARPNDSPLGARPPNEPHRAAHLADYRPKRGGPLLPPPGASLTPTYLNLTETPGCARRRPKWRLRWCRGWPSAWCAWLR